MPVVAGIENCSGGWLAVMVEVDGDVLSEEHYICASLKELFSLNPGPVAAAVNLPMGLPDLPAQGGRECDREARKVLGKARGSGVFSPPHRNALDCTTPEQAREQGVGRRSFILLPQIRELDRIINPQRQSWIKEAHPELSFYTMDGLCPVEEKRRTVPGRHQRTQLLRQYFYQVDEGLNRFPSRVASPDDVLDAYAAAWTAMRVLSGEAGHVPKDPPRDSRGIEMAIWY